MLPYEQLRAFASLFEQDVAPQVDPETEEIVKTAYDEGRHVYTINFQSSSDTGEVEVKVHVQWSLIEQLFLHRDHHVSWSAYERGTVHLHLTIESQPGVEYTAVLFKDDLRKLWERINSPLHPYPENESCEDVWVKLFNRGVWEV